MKGRELWAECQAQDCHWHTIEADRQAMADAITDHVTRVDHGGRFVFVDCGHVDYGQVPA